MWPENTTPFVTNGDTNVGYSVGCCHLILPVLISIAVIVPFRTPFAMETNTGTVFPSVPLTKKSHTA